MNFYIKHYLIISLYYIIMLLDFIIITYIIVRSLQCIIVLKYAFVDYYEIYCYVIDSDNFELLYSPFNVSVKPSSAYLLEI